MRRLGYKEDYVSYWNSKGAYGEERVKRMFKRKQERYLRRKVKRERRRSEYCPYCGRGMYDDCW